MRALIWVLVVVLLLVGALAALGWVLSSRMLVPAPYGLMPEFEITDVRAAPSAGAEGTAAEAASESFAGETATWPPMPLPEPLAAATADAAAATVVLPEPVSARQHANTLREGVYALMWEGGHGLLGPVLSHADGQVQREVRLLSGQLPQPGAQAHMDNFVYRQDPMADLGLEFEELTLAGPVGDLRAWFVPADGGTAVLMLHGRRRGELIELQRPLSAFNQLGLPALALAYRNHDASADSPDGLFHYGASEWEDALVGARELARRGYDRVVLYGASMGGAVALEALERWPADAPEVVGIVLDSPLVDPYPVIALGAEKAGLPLPDLASQLGILMAGVRTGADFGGLRQYRTAGGIAAPVLLFAGEDDSTVPIESIDRFAAAVAAPLTYVRLAGVEHVEAWNQDPARFQEQLRTFLASLDVRAEAPASRGFSGH